MNIASYHSETWLLKWHLALAIKDEITKIKHHCYNQYANNITKKIFFFLESNEKKKINLMK